MLTMGKNDLVSKTFMNKVVKNITSKKISKKGKKKAIDKNSKNIIFHFCLEIMNNIYFYIENQIKMNFSYFNFVYLWYE